MKFSASMMKKWSSCSLAGYFQYVEKLPTQSGSAAVYGSALHKGLEDFNNGATEEEAIQAFYDYMESNPPDYWNRRTTYTGYMDSGPKIIEDYIEKDKWSSDILIGTEKRFMVDMGDHQLSGIIDYLKIPKDHSKLIIGDYKSSGKKPNADSLRHDLQMTSYHYAVQQKEFWCGYPGQEDKYAGFENGEELYEHFKSMPIDVYWYHLRTNEAIHVGERSMADYAKLYRIMEMIAKAIELEVFVPTINGDNCTMCDFQEVCPVYW